MVTDVLQAMIKQDGTVRHPLNQSQTRTDCEFVTDASPSGVSKLKNILDAYAQATGLLHQLRKNTLVSIHVVHDSAIQFTSTL